MRFWMLGGAVFLAIALWGGYWWIASSGQQAAIEKWAGDRRAAGWDASYEDLSVSGFPGRFDTTLTTLRVADPKAGWAWAAPRFSLFALSYEPNRWIARWPAEQFLVAGRETLTIRSSGAEASLAVDPALDLPLNRTSIIIPELEITSDADWSASAEKMDLHIRQSAANAVPDNAYDFAFNATNTVLPPGLRFVLDPAGALPDVVSALEGDGWVSFDQPVNRQMLEGEPRRMTDIALHRSRFDWGGLKATAAGRLAVRPDGRPEGEVHLTVRNWRALITAAIGSGALTPELGDLAVTGLSTLAMLSGDPNRIKTTLTFENGRVRMGPVPLGPAPLIQPPL